MIPKLQQEVFSSSESKDYSRLKSEGLDSLVSDYSVRNGYLKEQQPVLFNELAKHHKLAKSMDLIYPGIGVRLMTGFFIKALESLYKQQEVNELEEMYEE